MMDIYSRKIVGWEVHHEELAAHAAELIDKACQGQRIHSARQWVQRFVTPEQRHERKDHDLLKARKAVYEAAKCGTPARLRRAQLEPDRRCLAPPGQV